MAESSSVEPLPHPLPSDFFHDFDSEQAEANGAVEGQELLGGGEEGEREEDRPTSPQFSTTSTVSGELDNTRGSNESLGQNGHAVTRVGQSSSTGEQDDHIVMTNGAQGNDEPLVAKTTGTWERFEPTDSKSKWETFESSGEREGEREGEEEGANGTSDATGDDETGAVCAADALVSTGWTALGEDPLPRMDVDDREYRNENLPFRQTHSMRATTNRKVQIVDALKQQRRLSNTSLDRDTLRGAGPFANEDELSRRYNVEREWQVFVKMNKRVPGTRSVRGQCCGLRLGCKLCSVDC